MNAFFSIPPRVDRMSIVLFSKVPLSGIVVPMTSVGWFVKSAATPATKACHRTLSGFFASLWLLFFLLNHPFVLDRIVFFFGDCDFTCVRSAFFCAINAFCAPISLFLHRLVTPLLRLSFNVISAHGVDSFSRNCVVRILKYDP
jgi:hypothetical protein